MASRLRGLIATMLLFLGIPLTVLAGPCDAYFSFDDSLADTSGNGYHGQMIGAEGASATPIYTDGKFGRALRLDGTRGMRALIDLHWDICPQVTISAWIKVDRDAKNDSPVLLSSGQGSGPGLYFSPDYLRLNGTENGIFEPSSVRTDNWMFVAGVYNYESGDYELYWGRRGPSKGNLSEYRYEPESAFWVGTENDVWGVFVSGIAVDELRIMGRELGKDDVMAIRAQVPATDVEP